MIDKLTEAAIGWNELANDKERKADWDDKMGIGGQASRNMANACRRAVVSLFLEQETGLPHCSCCLKPRDLTHPARKEEQRRTG